MPDSLGDMKQRFARQLSLLLERAYGGRPPSLAALARDLSLRSPHLPHVSTETVRKWIRGAALPQSPRMQVLIEWLGEELLEPLAEPTEPITRLGSTRQSVNQPFGTLPLHTTIGLIEMLEPGDRKLVFRLIQSLARKAETQSHGLPTVTPADASTGTSCRR